MCSAKYSEADVTHDDDTLFREIRSVMHQNTLSPKDRARLWDLLCFASEHLSPWEHESILEYTIAFAHHFQVPFAVYSGVAPDELLARIIHSHQVAPHVGVEVIFDHDTFPTQRDDFFFNPAMGSVHALQLMYVDLQNDVHSMLYLQSSSLSNLKRLHIEGCDINAAHIDMLMQFEQLTSLKQLNLCSNDINTTGVRTLCKRGVFELQGLDLSDNPICDEGAFAIANAQCLSCLQTLNLDDTHISPKGLTYILESPFLSDLSTLTFRQVNVIECGVAAL